MTNTLPTPPTRTSTPATARPAAPTAPAPEPLAVLAAPLAVSLEAAVARFRAATDQNLGHLETQALAGLPAGPSAAKVAEQIAYLKEHRERLDDRAGRRVGEPIGSGPVAATCRQAQCRFKRPGQFWSSAGDEVLLCLETFRRNEHWSILFSHTAFDPANN